MAKTDKVKDKSQESESVSVGKISQGVAVNAIVEQAIGRTGARGEVTQVKAKVLSGIRILGIRLRQSDG